jgi:hypothetical protein
MIKEKLRLVAMWGVFLAASYAVYFVGDSHLVSRAA